MSGLTYGDVIYHNQNTFSMKLLEKIQYQAGLIVTNCWKGTSRIKLYNVLGWKSLSQRRTGRHFALYHKILSDRTPSNLKNLVQDVNLRTERFFPFCAANWPTLPDSL